MLIALLLALGVDLIVVVAVAVLVLGRRRWVKRQPGAFAGAIRVTGGELDGLGSKWKRGSGHWVRDVLVWNKAPLLLTNRLIPVDRVGEEREAAAGEVKRLGDEPIVVELQGEGVTLEIAARPEHRALATGLTTRVATPGPVAPPPA